MTKRDRIKYAVCSAAAVITGAALTAGAIYAVAWIMSVLEKIL